MLALLRAPDVTAQELPALGADRAKLSVSGLSSGGFMAVQYAVALSSEVMGVGVVAGGLYNCGAAFPISVISSCMQRAWTAPASWSAVTTFSRAGSIDPAENIARQRVYLFSGSEDAVVAPAVVRTLLNFYVMAGVPGQALRYRDDVPATHAFVSASVGGRCGKTSSSYVVRCFIAGKPYDQPYEILNHIYGLKVRAAVRLSAAPIAFDQRPYGSAQALMANTGYVFIPASCRKAGADCAVHVVFHGCMQSADTLGSDIIYGRLGYNRWADRNGIILLYPQVNRTLPLPNPYGCWDWWGYSQWFGFQLRHAPQIDTVRRMVTRLQQAS